MSDAILDDQRPTVDTTAIVLHREFNNEQLARKCDAR